MYASQLPGLVRTALALDDVSLARKLVGGVQPTTPIAEHALLACHAQLAEATGDHVEAAKLYAEAVAGWQQFGDVPEVAYALLGLGRSLVAAGDPGAQVPLGEARELFASLGYRPALATVEALLEQDAPATL